jgi:hypothetical protein
MPTHPRAWSSTGGSSACAAVWAVQPAGFSSCDTVPDHYLVVSLNDRNAALCSRGTVVSNFQVGLGFNTSNRLYTTADVTPPGTYFVLAPVVPGQYGKALLLGSPSTVAGCTLPAPMLPPKTYFELHGGGSSSDWTFGDVAFTDPDLDAVMVQLSVGDTVIVQP